MTESGGSRALPAAALLLALLAIAVTAPAKAASTCGDPPRVTLDIGHSPGRPGAISARGKPEYAFNRRFVGELKAKLAADGFAVGVLNQAGADISLGERGRRVHALDRGVFLSIHHDSVQPRYLSTWTVDGRTHSYSDVFSGFSVFVSSRGQEYERSTGLARGIGEAMRRAGFRPSLHHGEAIKGENRPILDAANGLYRFDGLAVLRNAVVPAALLEVGIIVNRDEEASLERPEVRARAVGAVAAALGAFCTGKLPPA